MDMVFNLTGVILDLLSWILIVTGAAAALIGAFGILRLPDVYARMHAAGIIDTFGVAAVMLGLFLQADSWIVAVKLVLVALFIFFTSPTATHALARAAIHGGVRPKAEGEIPPVMRDDLPPPPPLAPETGAPETGAPTP
ncbi:MAG: monovalent cation/H(+) antiporter subunit G [Rhodospirillales bacterium]